MARNTGRVSGVKSKGDQREFYIPLLFTERSPGRVPQAHLITVPDTRRVRAAPSSKNNMDLPNDYFNTRDMLKMLVPGD